MTNYRIEVANVVGTESILVEFGDMTRIRLVMTEPQGGDGSEAFGVVYPDRKVHGRRKRRKETNNLVRCPRNSPELYR